MADSSWIDDLLASSDTLSKRRPEKRGARNTVAKYAVMSDHTARLKEQRRLLSVEVMLAAVSGSCTGSGESWERATAATSAVTRELQRAVQLESPGYVDLEDVPKMRAVYANEISAVLDSVISDEIDRKKGIDKVHDLRDKASGVTAADAVLVRHIATSVPTRPGKLRSRPPSMKTLPSFRSASQRRL